MNKAIFEILKTGTHRGGTGTITLSENNINDLARFYSENLKRAPLVLGHPLDDKPELGTVKKLYKSGDRLFAEAEIKEDLVKMIKSGEISGISSAMYFSEAKDNPIKGLGLYLKHVGFLEKGKDEPAVKGMLNPEISVSHIATFSENENNFILLNESKENQAIQEHKKIEYFTNVLGVNYCEAFEIINK